MTPARIESMAANIERLELEYPTREPGWCSSCVDVIADLSERNQRIVIEVVLGLAKGQVQAMRWKHAAKEVE